MPKNNHENNGVGSICFGLDRKTDETSLHTFLQLFANEPLLKALIPRLSDKEINAAVDFLTQLMNKHLTKNEYHELFLDD